MAVRTATVLFKDGPAGTLVETAAGGSRFSYLPGQTQAIACCLPVARREHEWPHGVHPFFQHLTPEGWLRERQARAAGLAEGDDLGFLLAYGGDCIGAVSIQDPAPPRGTDSADLAQANPGRTISGLQPKLLVVKAGRSYRPAGPSGPAPFIAKFNSESVPDLVRNEALSLRWIAAVLGQAEVARFKLGHVAGFDTGALIVTRFDRDAAGAIKYRQEDFAQILCRPRGLDLRGKYDAGHEDLAKVIAEHSARPAVDLDRLFRRLIAFASIGNCDAHLKNFSLLETKDGLRLSPAYDVINTTIYGGQFDRTLALRMNGAPVPIEAATRRLLTDFALGIGIRREAVDLAFESLARKAKRAAKILQPPSAEPADGFRHRFAESVGGACLRILGQ
ncbi:MAG: type II toxin-antitoxin system HipA family toxin [Alphaproteobacteria bacterium]|nr:type II toxin-antitoxin system HipA family toxin [Alphaproteobacteria bacterium]